jgi:hypothetical protein
MPDPSPDKPNLSTHPLVAKLKGDSDTPPSLVALTGYFGPSKKADSIRLYASLDFHSYFEIPKAAIVATTPVDSEDDQSPTVVHVKAGTPVDAVQTSTQPVESYLQGGISAAHLQGGMTGGNLGAFEQLRLTRFDSQCCPQPSVCCGALQGNPTLPVHPIVELPTNPACRGPALVHPTPTATFAPFCHPITAPPCSGVFTQCCPVQNSAATVCTQIGCMHPTPTAVPTNDIACIQLARLQPTTTVQPTHPVFCTHFGCVQPTPTVLHTHQVLCTHFGCVQPTTTVLYTHQLVCTQVGCP